MSDDDCGYVVASRNRQVVLDRLDESPATPSTITEDAPIQIAHVSRAVQELRDRDLVELLVPEDRRKGRVYGITEEGEEVVETVREWGELDV